MTSLNTPYLGIVLAHGKAREAVLRHEPIWLQNCDRLVYFTPCDDPLRLPGRIEYSVGKSCNYCADTNLRCREALRFANMTGTDRIMLIEWDSMIFGPVPGILEENFDVVTPQFWDFGNAQFQGTTFLHFPILLTGWGAHELVRHMDNIPDGAEGGFTDRYIGYAAQKAKSYIGDMHKLIPSLVYTQNHIDLEKLPDAIDAYRRGARWSHGIKDAAVFDTLKNIVDEQSAVTVEPSV